MTAKAKVLHVTEALGGGITSAINTYIHHSSEFDHYLFASIRESDVTGEEHLDCYEDIFLVSN